MQPSKRMLQGILKYDRPLVKEYFKNIIDKSRIFFIYIIDTSKRQDFFQVLIFKGKYLTSQVRHTTIVYQNKNSYLFSRQWFII